MTEDFKKMFPNKLYCIHQKFVDFFIKFIPYALKNIPNSDCQKKLKYLKVTAEKLKENAKPTLADLTGNII